MQTMALLPEAKPAGAETSTLSSSSSIPLPEEASRAMRRDPFASWSTLATIIFGIFSLILSYKNYRVAKRSKHLEISLTEANSKITRLQNALEDSEQKLHNLEEHIADYFAETNVSNAISHDVIFLGPKNSGKSSIIQLWNKPWTNIYKISATAVWSQYSVYITDLDIWHDRDPRLNVERTRKNQLYLNIHDYPGEDKFRFDAVDSIDACDQPVLCLVFDSDPTRSKENGRYYSNAFLKKLSELGPQDVRHVAVVFNKIDLISTSKGNDERIKEIRSNNEDALDRISQIFSGMMAEYFVSADDNTGLMKLMAAVLARSLTKEQLELIDAKHILK